ncbi:MAG: hypothetical protein Q9220_003668 [cf. Caloplaca sp. 1 TL-2023]
MERDTYPQKRASIDAMSALSWSKAECRKMFLQKNGKPYDQIVIGALIPRQNVGHLWKPWIVLLLKRAALDPYSVNTYEIPNGEVKDFDANILDAVKRVVLEETGMEIGKVMAAVDSCDYATAKEVELEHGGKIHIWKTTLQLNFICDVTHQHGLKLKPEKHAGSTFVGNQEMIIWGIPNPLHALVAEGLAWLEDNEI